MTEGVAVISSSREIVVELVIDEAFHNGQGTTVSRNIRTPHEPRDTAALLRGTRSDIIEIVRLGEPYVVHVKSHQQPLIEAGDDHLREEVVGVH